MQEETDKKSDYLYHDYLYQRKRMQEETNKKSDYFDYLYFDYDYLYCHLLLEHQKQPLAHNAARPFLENPV